MKSEIWLYLVLWSICAAAWAGDDQCVSCHEQVTPGIVKQFHSGKMSKAGVSCATCHGDGHQSAEDFSKAKMPTPQTCAQCHPKQAEQFQAGKHNLAWIAASSMPMWAHQPTAVVGEGYKGCAGCHKLGAKPDQERAKYRYGNAQCDACHTRHAFNKSEAQDPRACMTCHMGFDHPQWEMWSSSKHGAIWQIEGAEGERAPTCQTCHMDGGNHEVRTSWGFLAVRLPEEDEEWLADRVTILKALGVLDAEGNPTARLDLVKAGDVARLDKASFDGPRQKMIEVCSRCHGKTYATQQLAAGDEVVREMDKIMAKAIREVQALYEDGILQVPEDWTFAPDILQFYEAKTAVEQELWVMFLEYRMRAFQGAFHMNPDYMHWYGWAPMKESLQKIRDEARRIREEHQAESAAGAAAG